MTTWKTTTTATAWNIYVTDNNGNTHRAGMVFGGDRGEHGFRAYSGSDSDSDDGRYYPTKANAVRYLRNLTICNLSQATLQSSTSE